VVGKRLGLVGGGVLGAAVGVGDQLDVAAGARWPRAIRRASSTRSVRMWEASSQPTTLRENASITNQKNEAPSQKRR
jgi:hypothetical protein